MAETAGIYTRQSHGRERSIEEQTGLCLKASGDERWKVHEVYEDKTSASRFAAKQRPGWSRLLADLEAGCFGILVMWESSRGDRKLSSWSLLLELCQERGTLVHVVSHGRTYDPRVPRDWRVLADDGVDNQYESEKIALRVQRGVRESAMKGKPHGRIPYGYERIYDPKTRELVEQRPDLTTAPIVREIITRIASGDPISAVTNDFNARGIPSPDGKIWNRSHLRKIAMNPVYAGKRQWQGELYEATWPGLVTVEQHEAVKRRLSDPARKTTIPGRQKYLLSFLARCGECGGHLKGYAPKSRPYAQYTCENGCTYGRMDAMDALVERITREETYQPAFREALGRLTSDDAAAVQAREDLANLRARLDEASRLVGQGKLELRYFMQMKDELEPQIKAAERRAAAAPMPAVPNWEDVMGAWEIMGIPQKRELIAWLCKGIWLYRNTNRARGSFDAHRVEFEFATRPGARYRFGWPADVDVPGARQD